MALKAQLSVIEWLLFERKQCYAEPGQAQCQLSGFHRRCCRHESDSLIFVYIVDNVLVLLFMS